MHFDLCSSKGVVSKLPVDRNPAFWSSRSKSERRDLAIRHFRPLDDPTGDSVAKVADGRQHWNVTVSADEICEPVIWQSTTE